jgi:AcrR family transcriptional regulator
VGEDISAGDKISVDKTDRRVRADAQRNLDALIEAAKAVFASSGVDAPVRDIAEKAGVGVGTVYRHFPQRADLVAAVFRREIDACAAAAASLAATHPPREALDLWIERYVVFLATKRGLATALHSNNPVYADLPTRRNGQLIPALKLLLDAAVATGDVRPGVDPYDLLNAVGSLYMTVHDEESARSAQRMVSLLLDGLRYGAKPA